MRIQSVILYLIILVMRRVFSFTRCDENVLFIFFFCADRDSAAAGTARETIILSVRFVPGGQPSVIVTLENAMSLTLYNPPHGPTQCIAVGSAVL